MTSRATETLARWQRAFGVAAVAAAHVLATARQVPGDWRTILNEVGLVEQVVKQATTELLQCNEGKVLALSPLAAGLLTVLPDARWTRREVALAACMWLGLTPRFDLLYDRPVAGLQKSEVAAAA
jgi:hypothetical protein